MTTNRKSKIKGKNNRNSALLDFRDLVRLLTVLLFVPWFAGIATCFLGFEPEFEAEIVVLVTFIIFGTFWCGWLCPFGNVSYFVNKIGKNLFPSIQIKLPEAVDRLLRHAKYIFLAAFVFVIVTEKIDYFFGDHMEMYKSTLFTSLFISWKKYFILMVPLLWPRFFCKYLCFQKAAYNLINRILPITTIKRDDGECISCGKCDKSCPMNIKISEQKIIAGADCIGCYVCVDKGTCPDKAGAMKLSFLGQTVNPLIFGIVAMMFYYALTYAFIVF